MTNSGWDALDRSHTALRAAVSGVPEDGWELASPCAGWTVTQVLQHALGDQHGYAATLTGTGFPDEDPFAPSGALTGPPAELVASALGASADAFAAVAPDAEAVAVPLPQGPLPAWLSVGACALDAAVHGWDIAVATGQEPALEPSLAKDLMAVAVQIVEPLRAFAFAPALPPDPADDEVATLLRYLGRDPQWKP